MDRANDRIAFRMELADEWATDKKESARILDTNGWYEVKNNPLSKAGIFEYAGRQLPDAPDPDKLYRVYRPAEELDSEETKQSFKLIPWIDDHMMLGNEDEGLTPAEKKGIQGVVGEGIHFDGTHLRGNIKVFSEAMKNLIDAGKIELSAGYRCTYDWTPGEVDGQSYDLVQRNIRGNHLALVKEGRMGPDVAVLDHYSFTLDAKDIDMAEEEKEGGSNMTVEEAKELLKQIVPLVKDIQALFGDDEPDGDEGVKVEEDEDTDAPPDMKADPRPEESEDEEEVEIEEKPMMKEGEGEKKEDKGMDAKEITDHVMDQFNRREKLYSKLSPVIGAFDHSTMTEKTMADYGCKKLGLNYPESARVVALNAHLDALASVPVREHAAQDSNEGGFVDAYLEGK